MWEDNPGILHKHLRFLDIFDFLIISLYMFYIKKKTRVCVILFEFQNEYFLKHFHLLDSSVYIGWCNSKQEWFFVQHCCYPGNLLLRFIRLPKIMILLLIILVVMTVNCQWARPKTEYLEQNVFSKCHFKQIIQ